MHVRLTTITGATDIDGGITYIHDQVEPQLSQQKGFRGISAAGDRATGLVTVLSQWDTEADLEASESAADKVRADALKVLGGQGTVDRFEQMVWETVGAQPAPGAKLFIRATRMDPAMVDDNLAFFKETVLPEIRSAPGVLAVRNLINRATGEGRVSTVWADEESRARFQSGNEARQTRAESRGIAFTGDLSLDVLYASMR